MVDNAFSESLNNSEKLSEIIKQNNSFKQFFIRYIIMVSILLLIVLFSNFFLKKINKRNIFNESIDNEIKGEDSLSEMDSELQNMLNTDGSFSIKPPQNLDIDTFDETKELSDKIISLADKFHSFIIDETPIEISKANKIKQILTKYQSFLEYYENLGERHDPYKYVADTSSNCKEICKKILADLDNKDINEIRKEIKEEQALKLFRIIGSTTISRNYK